jgi:hypothetical protein
MQVLMMTLIIIAAPSGVYLCGFHLDALKFFLSYLAISSRYLPTFKGFRVSGNGVLFVYAPGIDLHDPYRSL